MPNHFHLLRRTGKSPIAGVMRRVLTGYADHGRPHSRTLLFAETRLPADASSLPLTFAVGLKENQILMEDVFE